MMNLPSSIQKTLLLGTSRAANLSFDDMPETLQQALFENEKTDKPEAALWERVAAYDLWKRAGAQALSVKAQDGDIAAPDSWQPCSALAEKKLYLLLQGTYPELKQEWLTLAQQFHCHLPYRFLPAMLDLGVKQTDLRIAIEAVLGERGRWLARQRLEWQWAGRGDELTAEALTEIWETGTLEQRMHVLRQVRAQDADAGRNMLTQVWKSEAPEHRVKLISCLNTGASSADQEFLELALDDKRKEVRAVAQAMLLTIPNSSLELRMRTRLDKLLLLEEAKNGAQELLINLPAERDKAMQRDGVGNGPHYGIGEKAGWLLDMLTAVSPLYWTEKWQLSAAQLLQLLAKTEYQEVLMTAWAAALQNLVAAAAAKNNLSAGLHEWCVEISKTSLYEGGKHSASLIQQISKIWASIPSKQSNDFLQGLLDDSPRLWTSAQLRLLGLLNLIAMQKLHWSAKLSLTIITRLRNSLISLGADHWFIKQILSNLAMAIDPVQMKEYEYGWPVTDSAWEKWQAIIDDFLALLRFRSEMLQSFQEQA